MRTIVSLLLVLALVGVVLGAWELPPTWRGVDLAPGQDVTRAGDGLSLRIPSTSSDPRMVLALSVRSASTRPEPAWAILEGAAGTTSETWRRRLLPGANRLLWELPDDVRGRTLTLRSLTPGAAWQIDSIRLLPAVGLDVLAPLAGLGLALALGLTVLIAAVARHWRSALTRWVAAVLGVLAAGAALRLYSLGGQGFWLDEILTLIGAQSVPWILNAGQLFEHPPLQYLVVWAIHEYGETEVAVRLPFVLFGVGSLAATAWLGRVLVSPAVGLVAGALLAVSPFHVNASQTARPYALVVCLSAIMLAALWRALEANRAAAWLGFVAAASLLTYSHYLGLLAVGLAALVCVSQPSRWRESLLALAAVGLLYAPWLPIAFRLWRLQQGTGTLSPGELGAYFRLVMLPELVGDQRLVWVGVATALIGLGASWRRPRLLALFLLWTVGPFLGIWLVQPNHFIATRHLIFLLPVFACLVGRGVVAVGREAARGVLRALPGWPEWTRRGPALRWSRVTAVGLAFLLTAAPSAAGLHLYYETRRGPDWREVARVLREVVRGSDRIQVTAAAYYPLRHYYGDQIETLDLDALRRARRRGPTGQRIWVLRDPDAATAVSAWLDRGGTLVQSFAPSWSLPEAKLYRVERVRSRGRALRTHAPGSGLTAGGR